MRRGGNSEGSAVNAGSGKLQCDSSVLLHKHPFRSDETPLFFGYGKDKLYGVLHLPLEPARETGVVICPPLYTDTMEAHGILVNLARSLAENRFPALRFDYRGFGESDGEWSDYFISDYLEDIDTAIELLRGRTGIHAAGLLGLRMGGTLAVMKLAGKSPASFAAALEPIVRGAQYMQDLLRLKTAEQLKDMLGVKTGISKLTEAILSGEEVVIGGFIINKKQYDSLMSLNLEDYAKRIAAPAALFALRNPQTSGEPVRELFEKMQPAHRDSIFREIDSPPFWRQTPYLVRRVPVLFDAVLEWLNQVETKSGK
ncbi:MAG: alpha/beta fold hydrolase [Candidatus Latescibacterota bacterium]